jgi:hypothetical protein
MPDIMLDAFINLFILVSALIVILLTLYLIISGSGQPPSMSLMICQAGWIVLSVTLAFFSFPLMSYMSYELILIGYLPNYRVTLVGMMMAVLICSNYLSTHHYENEKGQRDILLTGVSSQDDQQTHLRELLACFSFLPHAIPLLEGIMIGGLQNWGLAQLLMLRACELIVLLHMILQPHARLFVLRTISCATVRLLTLLLSIMFSCPLSEIIKQWIGYLVLCLHTVAIFFSFLLDSAWQLSQAAWKRIEGTQALSRN